MDEIAVVGWIAVVVGLAGFVMNLFMGNSILAGMGALGALGGAISVHLWSQP